MSRLAIAVVIVGILGISVLATNTGDCEFTITVKAAENDPEVILSVGRTMSKQQVPFVVEYKFLLPADFSLLAATSSDPSHVLWSENIEGRVVFSLNSNARPVTLIFTIEDGLGNRYHWIDESVEFFVHSQTDIVLNANEVYLGRTIESVQWAASNFDPADSQTFPITDASSPITTLRSDWPNTISLECVVHTAEATLTETMTVLVFARDGAAWGVRSLYAPLQTNEWTRAEILEVVQRMVPILNDIGYTHVNQQEYWRYGYPDENDIFEIRPYSNPEDPRGASRLFDDLSYYFDLLRESGFSVNFEFSAQADNVPESLSGDYNSSGYGLYAGFINTEGYLYSEHGLLNMFLEALDWLAGEEVAMVCLEAEEGWVVEHGGEALRTFYGEVIERYRAAGYAGLLTHASSDWVTAAPGTNPQPHEVEKFEALIDPDTCGIPYAKMDLVSVTSYIPLADEGQDLSTEEMRHNALDHIREIYYPFHLAYDKPFFIEDMICHAVEGCSANPLASIRGPIARSEQQRWYAAWLRALMQANNWDEEPWISGISVASYFAFPEDIYIRAFIERNDYEKRPHLNDANGNDDLRMLLKVFMKDVPIDSIDVLRCREASLFPEAN